MCIRDRVYTAAFLIVLIGIGITVLGGVAYSKYKTVPDEDRQKDFKNICRATVGIGSFFIIGSILGFLGLGYNSKCLLFIFNITVIVMFLILIGIGTACLIYKAKDSDNWKCDKDSLLYDAENFSLNAQKILCQNDCPCKSGKITTTIAGLITSDQGKTRIQNCDIYKTQADLKQYKGIASSMKFIEEEFNCAGICTASNVYLFSNVNDGKPTVSCSKKIKDKFTKYQKYIGYVSLAIGIFFFLASCASCFAAERKKRQGGERYDMLLADNS
eukprot:TRINITY_DN447_c0_g1_i1.p2 TRINITY_DN447_c0_g1~~TRINITY_DN447_c0_g1_i1.p2  ORF type:complete len:272 (-),score=72.30 TRINITY_DN447_c0_g1_i1:159-974(-)